MICRLGQFYAHIFYNFEKSHCGGNRLCDHDQAGLKFYDQRTCKRHQNLLDIKIAGHNYDSFGILVN